MEEDNSPKRAPFFTKPLRPDIQVSESEKIVLFCHVEPRDDPDLEIIWFVNQSPLPSGHKFKLSNEFGNLSLTILYTYAEDSGVYSCIAKNHSGTAETKCNVECHSKKSMLLEPCQPESAKAITRLEAPKRPHSNLSVPQAISPVFITAPRSYENLIEGQSLHLECHVRPIDDPKLMITWFKNGQLLQAGHRIKHVFNFGYVGFDIIQMYDEDSGCYTCQAKNDAGSAEVSCNIKCLPLKSIYLESSHPEILRKIDALERHERRQHADQTFPEIKPYFVTQLSGPTDILKEGQTAHIQCRYEPNDDPNLKLEWIFNGCPLLNASRFRMMNNFGYAAIDMIGVIPEDTGIYSVAITNRAGSAVSNFELRCKRKFLQYIHFLLLL